MQVAESRISVCSVFLLLFFFLCLWFIFYDDSILRSWVFLFVVSQARGSDFPTVMSLTPYSPRIKSVIYPHFCILSFVDKLPRTAIHCTIGHMFLNQITLFQGPTGRAHRTASQADLMECLHDFFLYLQVWCCSWYKHKRSQTLDKLALQRNARNWSCYFISQQVCKR